MGGNRALRRAAECADGFRISGDIPLLTDSTELISPDWARDILEHHNKGNRPVSWSQVEAYSELMKKGEFALTAQGLVFDCNGNLLTGQTRLWAVVFSGCSVYMRVSRGSPPETGRLLDRGRQQTARDLASRDTESKHTPFEATLARAICGIHGNLKPSKDELAAVIVANAIQAKEAARQLAREKKSKALIMIVAALCEFSEPEQFNAMLLKSAALAASLDLRLLPQQAEKVWGRGSGFGLALSLAVEIVERAIEKGSAA